MRLRFDLKHLEAFVAVAEELSFRGAAERLHVSQPPLTRQIRELEEALGVRLFERGRQGTRLTSAGAAFLPDARALLGRARKIAERLRDRHGDDRIRALRAGYTTVFDPGLFADLQRRWAATLPDWELRWTTTYTVQLLREVLRGAIDIALVGMPGDTNGLTVTALYREPLVAILPEGHPLASEPELSLPQLSALPFFWIARAENPGFYDHYAKVFGRLGFRPVSRLPEPPAFHHLLSSVAAGQGWALIPGSLRRIQRDGVVIRPMSEGGDALWIGIGAAHLPERAEERAIRLFIDAARGTFGDRPGGSLTATAGPPTPTPSPAPP